MLPLFPDPFQYFLFFFTGVPILKKSCCRHGHNLTNKVRDNPNYAIRVTASVVNSMLPSPSSSSTSGLRLFQESMQPTSSPPPSHSQSWLCRVINRNQSLCDQAIWLVETCTKYFLKFTMPTYLGDGTQLRLWGAHFPVIGEYRQCPGIRFDNITRTFISYGDGQFQRHETGRMKASSMNIFLFIWKAALRTENKTEIELPFEEFLNQFFFLDLSGVAGRANDKGVFIGKDGSQVPAAVEAKIRKANQVFNHELLVAVGIALEKQNEFTGDASGGGSGSSSGGSKNTIESIFFCKSIHASLIELITEVNTKLALKTSMSYVPVRQGEPLAAMSPHSCVLPSFAAVPPTHPLAASS